MGCEVNQKHLPGLHEVLTGEGQSSNAKVVAMEKLSLSNGGYSDLLSEEDGCKVWQCGAYCSKHIFSTCKEAQFSVFCRGETRRSARGCNVSCSSGEKRYGAFTLLPAVAAVIVAGLVWGWV